MISVRPGPDRGHFRNEWLNSYHTFSFGHYYDPAHMGVSVLRVINDDTVEPGAGFPTHAHQDMEIVSYVLEGELEHRDSMGNGSLIKAGEVQRMSAGTGVTHSEFNSSRTDQTRFLQIWLEPDVYGIDPGYQQRFFKPKDKRNQLKLLVSPEGREGSISVHSDARVFGALLRANENVSHELSADRIAFIHVAHGGVAVNGMPLMAGDGAVIDKDKQVRIDGLVDNLADAEVLLFDLPRTNWLNT